MADLPKKCRWGCGFAVGLLAVWSLMVPADSISVFVGEALPQNLGWMMAAVMCALSAGTPQATYRTHHLILGSAMLLWLALVTWQAGFDNDARTGWNGFWQVVSLAACYLCAFTVCAGVRSRTTLVRLLVVGCLALSLHGIHQVTVSLPQQRIRYQEEPETVLREAGIDGPPGSAMRQRFEDRLLNSFEPLGTYALTNSLAVFLSGGLVLILAALARNLLQKDRREAAENQVGAVSGRLFQNTRESPLAPQKMGENVAFAERKTTFEPGAESLRTATQRFAWLKWSLVIVATAMILACWFLTRSRAAYAAVFAALAFWLAAEFLKGQLPRTSRRALAVLIGLGGVALLSGVVWFVQNDELVLSEAQKSLGYRFEYWQATWQMLTDHWLFGVGLGNFQSYYPQYKLEQASEVVADPHNWFLDLAITLSLPLACVVSGWLFLQIWPVDLRQLGFLKSRLMSGLAEEQTDTSDSHSSESKDISLSQALLTGAALGGGLCGLGLWLLGQVDAIVLASWLVAAAIGFVTWPLLMQLFATDLILIRSAAVGMLVCLLASGSWQASGIGVPLMILLGAGRRLPAGGGDASPVNSDRIGPAKSEALRSSSQILKPRLPAVTLATLGLVVFFFQTWQPVTSSWITMLRAEASPQLDESIELADLASRQDPLDSKPLHLLATARVQLAETSAGSLYDPRAQQAVATLDRWLMSDPVGANNWRRAGDMAFTLFAGAGSQSSIKPELIDKTVHYYRQAVRQYPSSVQLRVQLASALVFLRAWNDVHVELAEAIRLSDSTPHLDKKLETQTIWLPPSLVSDQDLRAFDGRVPAEPLVEWLRKFLANPPLE